MDEKNTRKVVRDFPFDVFDTFFLSAMKSDTVIKVRFYLFMCLNLSAQSEKIETLKWMAGKLPKLINR